MMKKLQQMQQQVEEVKARLDTIKISAESGGVKVEVSGNGQLTDISAPSEMSQEELIDHIIIAGNQALDQAQKTKEMEMAQSAKGIIPGM